MEIEAGNDEKAEDQFFMNFDQAQFVTTAIAGSETELSFRSVQTHARVSGWSPKA